MPWFPGPNIIPNRLDQVAMLLNNIYSYHTHLIEAAFNTCLNVKKKLLPKSRKYQPSAVCNLIMSTYALARQCDTVLFDYVSNHFVPYHVDQGCGQVQLVKYSNTSSTLDQVQVLCIFGNQLHQVLTHQVQAHVLILILIS